MPKINIFGAWKLYQPVEPKGMVAQGTVEIDGVNYAAMYIPSTKAHVAMAGGAIIKTFTVE